MAVLGDVLNAPHSQPVGHPFQCHDRFLSQLRRQSNLPRLALPAPDQLRLLPNRPRPESPEIAFNPCHPRKWLHADHPGSSHDRSLPAYLIRIFRNPDNKTRASRMGRVAKWRLFSFSENLKVPKVRTLARSHECIVRPAQQVSPGVVSITHLLVLACRASRIFRRGHDQLANVKNIKREDTCLNAREYSVSYVLIS